MLNEDCLLAAGKMPAASFHAIISDPPYGIEWLGEEWDTPDGLLIQRNTGFPSCHRDVNMNAYKAGEKFTKWFDPISKEMFRTLKPGGSCMLFSSTRTVHRPMMCLEEAGFEIKDVLMWNYHSGFPKAISAPFLIDKNLGLVKTSSASGHVPISQEGKKFDGWIVGRVKPAYEPIIWAVKPGDEPAIDTMIKTGVGGVNIGDTNNGRFTSNIIIINGDMLAEPGMNVMYGIRKYDQVLYQPKPDKSERDGGIGDDSGNPIAGDLWDQKLVCRNCGQSVRKNSNSGKQVSHSINVDGVIPCGVTCGCEHPELVWKKVKREKVKNIHPTVKPVGLFKMLINMVTMPGHVVADFFEGSGTCAIACYETNREHWGCEISKEYYKLAMERFKNTCTTFDPFKW